MTTLTLTHDRPTGGVTWVNIVHPDAGDMDRLAARCPQFHPLNLKDCLSELEFPKLDYSDSYVFLIVQMPVWDPQARISRPAEIDIFLTHDVLVTAHRGELKPLVDMFEQAQQDEGLRAAWMGGGAATLLYHLLDRIVDYCFPILHKVSDHLRHIEETIFDKDTRHLLGEVALLRRDIIVLRSMLRAQLNILTELIRGDWPFIQETLDPYWGDIGDHLQHICATLDQYTEVISGLSDTIDTLSSHSIDEVVRLLTITTILSLPVSLLATVFGMNVLMPYSEHPLMFFLIIVAGVGFTLWLIAHLRKRGFL